MVDDLTPAPLPTETPASADTHVNVLDPEGNLGAIPRDYLDQALSSGYQMATDEHVAQYEKEQKYGTLEQQVKTGLEGAASAATFGLSTGVERALGVNPEDIQGRAEVNPGAHMVGEGAGLVGSALIPGVGAANVLTKVGAGAAKLAGLAAPASTMAKIGSAAVKGAAENMLFQSGDEVSKMLASDSGHFSETAMADIGLAGLIGGGIGGALGSIHPLWEAAEGSKVGRLLKAISDKAGGVEAVEGVPASGVMTPKQATEHLIQTAGMDLDPVAKMAVSGDPEIQSWISGLNQSDLTSSGKKVQASLTKFRQDAGEGMAKTLGREVKDIPMKGDIDKYTTGKEIGDTLASEYHSQVDPLAKEYEAKKVKFSSEPLKPDTAVEHAPDYSNPYKPSSGFSVTEPGTTSQIAEKIAQRAQSESWLKLPDSDIAREVHKVLEVLPKQKTLNDLSQLADSISQQFQKDKLGNGPLFRAGGIIKSILRDAEADVIAQRLGAEAPHELERFAALRKAYGRQAELKEALESRLHAKGSTANYAKALKEMAQSDGEKVLRTLSGSGDAEILDILQKNFPKTAAKVREFHIDNVLSAAKDGDMIKGERLVKALYSAQMSPQLRNFIAAPEALTRIHAISQLLEKLNAMPHNFSNTARTIDKLTEYLPSSAISMMSMMMGHNPVMSGIAGHLMKPLAKDIPDAIKLGIIKFLGSDASHNPQAFKAMVDSIHSVVKGEELITKATKNVLKAGKLVLPESRMPTERDIKKLDKQIEKLRTDPQDLKDVAQNVGHYMPGHATQMSALAARATAYLNNLKPVTAPTNPLDSPTKPNPVQQAGYEQALKVACQPLVVIDKIQKGTLTPADVLHLNQMFPNLYAKLSQQLTNQIAETLSKGDSIPYKSRIGLSMFLAQPLDSTFTPEAIQATQPVPSQTPQEAQDKPPGQAKTSSLAKLPKRYQTATQAAESDRGERT